METGQQSYVSCIKINGVRILPPLITKDMRIEMNHYKQLAIAVEESLKAFHYIRQTKRIRLNENDSKIHHSSLSRKYIYDSDTNDALNTDSGSITSDASSVITNKFQISTRNLEDIVTEKVVENINNSEHYGTCALTQLQINMNSNKLSDFECNTNLENTISPDSGSVRICSNANQNNKESVSRKLNETEIASEKCKPEVPKSLDIIPITLDDSDSQINKECLSVSTCDSSSRDTPKLVRQGSYILESPSPILLAHMQTELSNKNYIPNVNYVPTLTTGKVHRRREWNIMQTKAEWVNQNTHKELIAIDVETESHDLKCTTNGTSHSRDQNVCSFTHQDTMCEPQLKLFQTTRSVDCLQGILDKEYLSTSSSKIINQNKENYINYDVKQNEVFQKWETDRNISILNMTNKLGGSLDCLNNTEIHPSKVNDEFLMSKSMDEKFINYDKINEPLDTFNTVITSEKLLTILTKIEEIHKRKMSELVIRQQKEQVLLKQEFEKQQMLLFAEIKKSSPGIPIPLEHKNLSLTNLDKLISLNNVSENASIFNVQENEDLNNTLSSKKDIPYSQSNNKESSLLALDYICVKNDVYSTEQHAYTRSLSTQKTQTEIPTITEHSMLTGNIEMQEHINVNDNQLYDLNDSDIRNKQLNTKHHASLLDCKTQYIPITLNSINTDKHVQAINVINAYVRGYLIRRMMQTERIIALKNTYKEAVHYMLKLHIDAPLDLSEVNFLRRLNLQCNAASMNIVELFAQSPAKRMQIIAHDRTIKQSRAERPISARSYSFATQRTLARKKLKEMEDYQVPFITRPNSCRSRSQTWASDIKKNINSPNILHKEIKRSTSAGTVRKPWR